LNSICNNTFWNEQFGGAQGAIIPGAILSVQGARAIGTLLSLQGAMAIGALSCRSYKTSFYHFCSRKGGTTYTVKSICEKSLTRLARFTIIQHIIHYKVAKFITKSSQHVNTKVLSYVNLE
jgi:hypothetical protein